MLARGEAAGGDRRLAGDRWSSLRASSPTDPETLSRWAGSVAVGAVLVAAGWYLASGEARLNDQIGPVNLAMAGLVVAAAGHANIVRRMRARLAILRSSVVSLLDEQRRIDERVTAPPASTDDTAPMLVLDEVVALTSGRYYHRPGCTLLADRPVGSLARASAATTGRVPCGVCQR